MGFLEKIETLINHYLSKLFEFCFKILSMMVPGFVKRFFHKIGSIKHHILEKISHLRTKSHDVSVYSVAARVKKFPLKEKISEIKAAIHQKIQEKNDAGVANKAIVLITLPMTSLFKWMSHLSPVALIVLCSFTLGSLVSSVVIFNTGKKLSLHNTEAHRAPASVEEEKFVRPDYYKKQTRDFQINAVKIPIYYSDINEYRSVMVDLSIILSNRNSKNYLSENEQILRDHFIMHIEPTIASFNLESEGKEIIRHMIENETSVFLKEHQIEGEAQEVKIIYIMAH